MTATDIALKVLARLDRQQQVTVFLALKDKLFLTPPYPAPDARNCFNNAKKLD